MSDKLIEIPRSDWSQLRNLYTKDWPIHFVSYYTINNYIDWTKSEPNIENIKFYSLNDDWTDGTYLIIDNSHVFFNSLSDVIEPIYKLLSLINFHDSGKFYLFVFVDRLLPAVLEILDKKNLYDDGGNSAFLYFLDKEIALNFEIRIPEGYFIKAMEEKHAKVANDIWVYRHPGSEEYLKALIKRNLNLGVFDENDDLVAWCVRVEYGLLGTLQVVDSHKRKGLGSLVVKALSKLAAEFGFNSGASVDYKNLTSQKLFENVGFKKVDKFHYVVPKPRTNK